ncbi:TonB-dependent receptor [Stenotrophomonas sp.]|uniref:TonB-dependent receptor n=1 Tax=Stenotrophomonas sp. TaxID=69392 RepID=UPI0028A7587F|nr:TonB-dependent receptor [Stenotrophomonas sp.]
MTHRLNRKKTPVTFAASALASAVLLALAGPAAAQDAAAANPTELDAVTVTGYRASVEKALDIKRSEKGMVDAVVAEDIANFPDLNLAESLQRIPGVTITRDAGEGRNISVRGLGPDFTRVRINGLEALTTVGGSDQSGGTNRSRGFDFNVFASDLFSQLIVRKTASADVEEGSLGATVDLRTARPFDYDGFTFAASGQGSFNDLSEKASPRAAALIADTWADGRFGGLLSVAYSERRVREEGSNTGRWYSASSNGGFSPSSPFTAGLADGVWHPYFPRYTLLEHDQKRLGVTASLQWKPTDNTEFALDALYSKIDTVRSEKYIEAISFAYSAQKQNMVLRDGYIDPTSGALLYGLFDGAGVRSEQRRDEWNTAFKQVSLSGEHRFSDAFKVNLLAGHSSSKHANPVQTTLIMDKANVSGYSYDFRDSVTHPTFNYGIDSTDTSGWTLAEVRLRPQYASNSFDNGALDFTWNFGPSFTLRGGLLAKDYEFDTSEYRRQSETVVPVFADGSYTVPAALVDIARLGGVAGSPDAWAVPDLAALSQLLGIYSGQGIYQLYERNATRRSVEERDRGAWLMGEFGFDVGSVPVSGNVGVRRVKTTQSSTGYSTVDGAMVLTHVSRDYTDTLPSLNLVAELAPDLMLRFGAAKVMARPGLSSLTPGTTLSLSSGHRYVNGGNPNLDPIRARTLDLGVEWYFQEGGLLGLALFHKDIESFVQGTSTVMPFSASGLPASLLDGTGVSPNEDFTFTRPLNTPGGDLKGAEFNYVQPFSFLPGRWSNLGLQLNYTWVDSQIQYLTSTGAASLKTDLTGLSKNSYNSTLFYEGEKLGARVSYTHRDGYYTQVPASVQGFSFHGMDAVDTVDASISWKIDDHLEVSLEGINLTNETSNEWVGTSAWKLPLTYTQTGREFLLGLRYKF